MSFLDILPYLENPAFATEAALGTTADQARNDVSDDDDPDPIQLGNVTVEARAPGPDDRKAYLQDPRPTPRRPVAANLRILQLRAVGDAGRSIVTKTEIESPFYKFFVTNAEYPQSERHMILSTFGDDPDFFMTFGEEPQIWTFSGMLRSEGGQGDWARAFDEYYRSRLRASLLVARNQMIRFRLGNRIMDGWILAFRQGANSQYDDAAVDFSMSFYVREHDYVVSQDSGAYDDGTPLTDGAGGSTHTVVSGDTLGIIAQRYGVSLSELRRVNGRTPQQDRYLSVGTVLVIPGRGTEGSTDPVRHVVSSGESLSILSQRYGVTTAAIIDSNPEERRMYNRPWNESSTIYVGETLVIPQ